MKEYLIKKYRAIIKKKSIIIFTIYVIIFATIFIYRCELNLSTNVILGVFIAGIAGIQAVLTYWNNSALKRMEFIDNIYKEFDEDKDLLKLEKDLLANKSIKYGSKSERALIKALGLIDRIYNYYLENIIDDATLSCIANEILFFYRNKGVNEYIAKVWADYEFHDIDEDIRYYSGLKILGEKCENKWGKNRKRKLAKTIHSN